MTDNASFLKKKCREHDSSVKKKNNEYDVEGSETKI